MGPSGSGKSTLLNLIAGIDKPSAGEIRVGGVDIAALSEGELAAWRAANVGFIFQFYNLMPVLSAFDNVELPLLLTNLSRARAPRARAIALSLVGLADRMDHYPNELSGGQQQRVAIARALIADPTLIVADEPTGDLDRATAEEILEPARPAESRARQDDRHGHARPEAGGQGAPAHPPGKGRAGRLTLRTPRTAMSLRAPRLASNAFRHKLRTLLTILGIVVADRAVRVLRTIVDAWYAGANASSSARLVTRSSVSLVFPLPITYAERMRQVEGVKSVAWANWFGGIYVTERNFFPQFAISGRRISTCTRSSP